jgi:hypothetical protein
VRGTELKTGDLVSCAIVAAEEYDLVARPVAPSRSNRPKARPKPRRRPPPGRLAVIDQL